MSEYSYLTSGTGLADQLAGLESSYNPSYMGDVTKNLLTSRSTGGVSLGTDGGMFSGLGDMLSNNELMSGISGLGSAIAQFAALPSQIEYAKASTDALKQNIATARQEQARRNKNISGFNSVNASQYT